MEFFFCYKLMVRGHIFRVYNIVYEERTMLDQEKLIRAQSSDRQRDKRYALISEQQTRFPLDTIRIWPRNKIRQGAPHNVMKRR